MKSFFIIFFCIVSFSTYAQIKSVDIVEEVANGKPKPLVYLTASCCKPCMDKLQAVTDTFGHNDSTPLLVVFDRLGLNDKRISRLASIYDTSYFRTLPAKYYPEQKKSGFVSIKVNNSNASVKAMIVDFNQRFGMSFTMDDIWFGKALYSKRDQSYITKEYDKVKIMDEVKTILQN